MDWTRPAQALHDQVRGLIPWPCASTELAGKRVKVFKTKLGRKTDARPELCLLPGSRDLRLPAATDRACGSWSCRPREANE